MVGCAKNRLLDRDSGEIINEKIKWVCDNLELKGQGKDQQGEYYYLFSWQNADEQEPRLEAVHLAEFGSETGWKQLKANGLKMTTGQGLTQWTEEENAQAILKNFLSWKEDFGEKSREESNIIDTLFDWINENEASFIEYPFDENQRTPNKTAGFRILPNEATKELEHFLLYPKAFKEILSNYPIKMACETLANAGILIKPAKPEQGYEYMFIVSQKLVGKRKVRAYKIKPPLQDENEN